MWVVVLGALLAAPLAAAGDVASVGAAAPDFTLQNTNGKQVSLSDFEGKVRVLEWVNPQCPFVKRHYEAATMKKLAETYGSKGVVWLTINSTHFMTAEESNAFRTKHELPYPILVDQSGKVGKAYAAMTTPHMYVIDAGGTLVYQGAIDDDPRGTKGDGAVNHVRAALDEVLAGKSVSVSETKPYGCSVKYGK